MESGKRSFVPERRPTSGQRDEQVEEDPGQNDDVVDVHPEAVDDGRKADA